MRTLLAFVAGFFISPFVFYWLVSTFCVPAGAAGPGAPTATSALAGEDGTVLILMGAVVAVIAVVFLIDRLLGFRSVAEGAILQLWKQAQRYRGTAPERLKLERRIVALAHKRLGMRQKTAAMVVKAIEGRGKAKVATPRKTTTKPKVSLPLPANDLWREWRKAA